MLVCWDPHHLYVIGHLRPDTDAIASALGYAWLLRKTGQPEAVAARAGHPAPQARFALARFGLNAPRLLTSAAPTFGHAARPRVPVAPEALLSDALLQLRSGERVVPVLDAEKKATGVISAMALARAFAAAGGGLMRTCGDLQAPAPAFRASDRSSDRRRSLLRGEADDFLVTDDDGRYLGVATRAGILEPPRARLVMVDHNELSQAVSGAEEAEIVAVLDHHRLANPSTTSPISFIVEPVGSTSTLVAERCRRAGHTPPPSVAGILLCGILSDTLVFRSPTCTPRDQEIAHWLAALAGVNLGECGEELLHASPGLAEREPSEVLDADRKAYQMSGHPVSVAQVEVTSFVDLPDCREPLLEALRERCELENLSLALLMVTDVTSGRSRLLAAGNELMLESLPFVEVTDGEWDLGDIVSRKKQLVPALEDTLREGAA